MECVDPLCIFTHIFERHPHRTPVAKSADRDATNITQVAEGPRQKPAFLMECLVPLLAKEGKIIHCAIDLLGFAGST